MPRHVAFVQSKSKFVNVAIKMLFAGVVIDTDQAALKDREHGLDAVRGHAVADVFAVAVVDRVVVEKQTANASVGKMFVGVQRRADLDVLQDGVGDRTGVGSLNLDGFGATAFAAFLHAENGSLADRTAPKVLLFVFVFVRLDAANVSLVDLDDALQLGQIIAAGFAEPVQNEPCRLLRDADFLGQLQARNPLPRRDQQVHRVDPLVQWNVAALEYSARPHGEILTALVAPKEAALARCNALAKAADRATRTFRPKSPFQIGPRRFHIGEQREQFKGGNGAFGHGLYPRPMRRRCGPSENVNEGGGNVRGRITAEMANFQHRASGVFIAIKPNNISKIAPILDLPCNLGSARVLRNPEFGEFELGHLSLPVRPPIGLPSLCSLLPNPCQGSNVYNSLFLGLVHY